MFNLRKSARTVALREILMGYLVVLCVGSVMALNPVAGAAVRYVATDGSDQAAGDAEAPFLTIAKALSVIGPGDTVHIRAGIYTEHVRPKHSGTADQPILIEGERGEGGEWKTIIDSSFPLNGRWVPAKEVGSGVYKTAYPGFEPFSMLVDGKYIPRIWPDHMVDGEGFTKLAFPPDQKVKTDYLETWVYYWDTMGAMFGCKDGTVYLRFRNRDDPNTKDLRAAPQGGGIEIADQSHLVFRDLTVRGGQNCVLITGPKAAHNVIENCRLVNGTFRVRVANGASHNVIRNNEMTMDFYAETCRTGSYWFAGEGDAVPYELRLKQHFYREYKLFFGPNGTHDYGVALDGVGPGNEVCGNYIYKGGQGIHVTRASDVRVHDNVVHAFSSIGLIPTLDRVVNVQFYDNLVYDCGINIRVHHVNEYRQTEPRSVYIYRNRLYQPPHVGEQIYFHYHLKNDTPDYKHPDIFIYQNSLAGGRAGLSVSGYADKCGGLPKTVVLNNVISSDVAVYTPVTFLQKPNMWAVFDYNWLGGAFKSPHPERDYTRAPWYGKHNLFARDVKIWDESELPDFILPAKSAARHAGLDLSKPFTLNGQAYPALPGMAPGYFDGPRPDPGAVRGK